TTEKTMRSIQVCSIYLVGMLFAAFDPAFAMQESRATLEGRIADQQGALIPGASVEVTSELTGVKQQTSSNEQGAWSIRFLNPGTYTVSIRLPGFRTFEQHGIVLQVADSKHVDGVLELGNVTETLTVQADAPLIETTSATSGTVIDSL